MHALRMHLSMSLYASLRPHPRDTVTKQARAREDQGVLINLETRRKLPMHLILNGRRATRLSSSPTLRRARRQERAQPHPEKAEDAQQVEGECLDRRLAGHF